MKTIAIDLDDTLNDFTATLQGGTFVRDASHALTDEVFQDYLARLRANAGDEGTLLSTEFTFFRAKIHQEVYARARARADGVAFLRALRRDGWRILILTQRDLRRAQDATRRWLGEHDIPFDYLFMAGNKIVFCKAWGIDVLVDNDAFNIEHGERYGVRVYYPAEAQPTLPARTDHDVSPAAPRAFTTFADILPWIAR
jgi:5'(3')-deoxyribonucleotidase